MSTCKHFFLWKEESLMEGSSCRSIQMQCRKCRMHLVEEEGNRPYRQTNLCSARENGYAVIETNVAHHTPDYVHQHAWLLVETSATEKVYKCQRHVRDWTKWAMTGTYVKPCNETFIEKIDP